MGRILAGIGLAAVLTSGAGAAPVEAATPERPDIVVVMVDDLGIQAMPALLPYLPNIRRMFGDEGITFSHAYGETPICCPGRAGFLTGLHSHRHGVITTNGWKTFLGDASRVTIATEARSAGYHTFHVGKYVVGWGLHNDGHRPPGWDRFASMAQGGYRQGWTMRINGGEPFTTSQYLTDWIRMKTLAWMANAPSTKPMLAWVTPWAAHHENSTFFPTPALRHEGACAGIGSLATPAYNEEDVSDKPAYIESLPMVPFPDGWPLQPICETLLAVDEMVGAMERKMAALGRDDVLWVFTADNGMGYGEHRNPGKHRAYATPLPLYVHWPLGRGRSPRTERQMVSNIDLAPTLCGVIGCQMGPYPNGWRLAGLDWSPLLRDEPHVVDRDAILEQMPVETDRGWWAVRTRDWHYVLWRTGEEELYDLTADPWELENTASSRHQVVRKMSDRLAVLLEE